MRKHFLWRLAALFHGELSENVEQSHLHHHVGQSLSQTLSGTGSEWQISSLWDLGHVLWSESLRIEFQGVRKVRRISMKGVDGNVDWNSFWQIKVHERTEGVGGLAVLWSAHTVQEGEGWVQPEDL